MYARDNGEFATPIGTVALSAVGETLTAVRLIAGKPGQKPHSAVLIEAARQIAAWFAGDRRDFDLKLAPARTVRGQTLRDAIVAIGYGETIGYGALAAQIGSGARAIGQACARNPFPLIVPCHRVLAAHGALGAYSAGDGPATKAWLIAHERQVVRAGPISQPAS